MSITTLKGHYSADTAYVVEDYPYGFRLRTQIRYWLESKDAYGTRLVSQTLNPKTGVWNKPKGSTYVQLGVMVRDEGSGHISWRGWSLYGGRCELEQFVKDFEAGMTDGDKLYAGAMLKVYAARKAKAVA